VKSNPTDFIEGGRVLADVGTDERLDELRRDRMEVIVEQVRSEAARVDDKNGIEHLSADPGVEAHLVNDRIYRGEPEIVEVEALPTATPSVRLQRVEWPGAGERLYAALARRIERGQRFRFLGRRSRRSGDISGRSAVDGALDFGSAAIARSPHQIPTAPEAFPSSRLFEEASR
jgi:hypothetical protein